MIVRVIDVVVVLWFLMEALRASIRREYSYDVFDTVQMVMSIAGAVFFLYLVVSK